jgi:hypothetical protein
MASFFDTLFAPFNPAIGADAAAQAAQAQTAGITQGMGALTDTYGQGRGALQSNFMQGLQPFLQNVGTANRGMSAIADAMGLNGPKGTQNAYASFLGTVEPAIQFGSQNALRNAAATGGGMSGSTLKALNDVAQNQAMSGWQNYVQGLSPFYNYSTANTQGVGNLYSGLGSALNQNYMGLGNNLASGWGAIGAANANVPLAAAQAEQGAGGNIWGTALGIGNLIGGSGGLGRFFQSDIRVKDDIERIGTLNDGLPIYRYRYKGSPRTEVGLMAQDVEKVNPEAVAEIGGIKHVDYARATSYSAGLDRYMRMAA